MTPIIPRIPLVSFKSRIGVEFRRFQVPRDQIVKFNDFLTIIQSMHQLNNIPIKIYYLDQEGELLPINNDDNLAKAIERANCLRTSHFIKEINQQLKKINFKFQNDVDFINFHLNQLIRQNRQHMTLERPLLKLFLEIEGNPYPYSNLLLKSNFKGSNLINMIMNIHSASDTRPRIGEPEDFRQVSSIIDADILPDTRRRVVLKRGTSDKPLGFFIRDGFYITMNSDGVASRNHGIFISRLIPGGLADSTNLLAENDEILEVNGVEVDRSKKCLEQVRDMMVANCSNLILTTRPAKSVNHHSINKHHRVTPLMINRDRSESCQSWQSSGGYELRDIIRYHKN